MRKWKKLSPEESADLEARTEHTLRMLQARIDYHTARLKQRHGVDYAIPRLEERIAHRRSRLKRRP